MAQGTDSRPEFPDPDRPLYTPDEEAQRQVVARIARARDGKRRRKASKPEDASTHHVTIMGNLPMGQHPYIGRVVLADALGTKHTTAESLAAHPERLDPWQVRQLCDLCGVTLEWLRGWEDENAYGRYETAEDVAAMYGHLSNEDRALVCDLLTRLLGADATRAIKHERWKRDNIEWLKRHPERVREIMESMTSAALSLIEPDSQSLIDSITATIEPAIRAAAEPMQDIARAITERHTAEEWELIESTADRLQSQGVDVDSMPVSELLARARGDSVER